MSSLFFAVFRVIQRVIRFMNVISTKSFVPKISSSKILNIFPASIRPPIKVTKFYCYAKLITLFSLPMMSLLQKRATKL